MEGGAKGQVGGMEMGEEERRRLAAESRGWRCHGCGGSTNEGILKAEEARCKEVDGKEESGKVGTKEQVPEELRFGFRDEVGKNETSVKGKEKEPLTEEKAYDKNQSQTASADGGENVHFAGPVHLRSLPSPIPISPPSPPTVAPAQPLRQPLPTRTTSVRSESSDNGVPGWVDKAIVGVVAGLLVIVVKKIAI